MYKIVRKEVLNPTVTLMEVAAPFVAKKAEPGQFIILRVDDEGERIPLTIADYNRQKGTITIIFQIVGASTFKLSSTIKNLRTKYDLYGNTIIEIKIKSYDRFFICNKKIAQQVYGDKYMPQDQLEILFEKHPKALEKIKQSPYYKQIIQTKEQITSRNVQALLEALGGTSCRADNNLDKYDIRGFVFCGAYDGYVTIIRDFKAIVPYRYFKGKEPYVYTYEEVKEGLKNNTDLYSKDTFNNTIRDYDPISFLGFKSTQYINPENYRVHNGYMKVQRKLDGKFNFINAKTKEFLSPIWFDSASNMDDNGFALVVSYEITETDEFFYVNEHGCCEEENIKTLFIPWEKLK